MFVLSIATFTFTFTFIYIYQPTNQSINQSINSGYVHTTADSFSWRHEKLSVTVWTARARVGTSRPHTSNMVPARLAERVWWTKSQSSLLKIYFRLSWFQSSLLLIHIRDRTNRCSHCTKVWRKIHSICNAPRSRSARRSFAPSQKSRRHTVFVCERKPFPVWF